MASIIDLPKTIESLSPEKRALFERFFFVEDTLGKLVVPKGMRDWGNKTYTDYKTLEKQTIIKVINKFTFEGALFNELRSKRPHIKSSDNYLEDIKAQQGTDAFCDPVNMTPEDSFGRVEGKNCITASNITKYDALHGVVIFKKHDPLDFTEDEVVDYLNTGLEWFKKGNEKSKKAKYPFLLWNCLWKSGAGMIHGHMQTVLGSGKHYAEAEYLNKVRRDYSRKHKSDYFQDIYRVHETLGLGVEEKGMKIFTSITPKKDKEITITCKELDDDVKSTIFKAVDCLKKDFSVTSFNVAIIFPPLKSEKKWEGFPVVVRILDRGSLSNKTVDFGSMEIYSGSRVIEADPYRVIEKLREKLK
jgi:hypothetical protein